MQHQDNAPARKEEDTRECIHCFGGGWVLEDARYDYATGELTQSETPCFICKGTGAVYLYGGAR